MIPIYRRTGNSRGVTLLELLVYSAIWGMLAVATMRVLGDSRMLRSNGRDRSAMALIAQSEIERVRAMPAEDLTEGSRPRADSTWPSDVAATVTLARRDDSTWLVDVRVGRDSVEGKPEVRLATVRPGGGA